MSDHTLTLILAIGAMAAAAFFACVFAWCSFALPKQDDDDIDWSGEAQ